MSGHLNLDRLYAKADAMYDRIRPGFVHAVRKPDVRKDWTELHFPSGLVCSTNSTPLETELMYNETFVGREYLRSGVVLGDGDTVIDVGANIGMFMMQLLRNYRSLTIHAVEPVPATFDVLKRNAARFPEAKVVLHNMAIGAESGATIEMVVFPHMTGNSTAHPGTKRQQRESLSQLYSQEELAFIYQEERVSVPSTTLSSLIRSQTIKSVKLLKLDAEGGELDILRGIEPEHWAMIDQMAIEVHDEAATIAPIRRMLESHGMRVVIDDATRDACGSVVAAASRG